MLLLWNHDIVSSENCMEKGVLEKRSANEKGAWLTLVSEGMSFYMGWKKEPNLAGSLQRVVVVVVGLGEVGFLMSLHTVQEEWWS